ncbi:MAG: nitrogen fixation protein NifZ, partial [Pseudomonadota bacterium]
QQFYIYAVDFVERDSIVGMRKRELTPAEAPAPAPQPTDTEESVS